MRGLTQMTIQRFALLVSIMLIGRGGIALGQASRPLTMRLDTLEQNVCGPKTFTMPLWVGDIPVSDSLYAVTVVLAWDLTSIELEDFVVVNTNTLSGGLSRQPLVVRDRNQGVLYIELGTDPSGAPIAGAGKPLLFLRGSITAPDTVRGQMGWIDITSASFSANVQYDPFERRPGIVRVVRDTTPAYTGRLSVARGEFDTLRFDTVDVTLDNISGRRVRSVSFEIVADTPNFVFVDTVSTGTIAGKTAWATSTVTIRPDTLRGEFQSNDDLTQNGTLLRLVIERRTTEEFAGRMEITRFSVNGESCLGKLVREGADVTAAAMPASSGVLMENGPFQNVRIVPVVRGFRVEGWSGDDVSIEVYDLIGGRVGIRSVEWQGPTTLMVSTTRDLPTGRYFVVIRDRNGYVNKQFTAKQ